MKVAFLGAGLMGAGFIRRLLDLGHHVQIWNRSPEKAKTLEAHGAVPCPTPAAAVKGVDRIHLILSEDQAVDATLEPLAGQISGECWIVDHSTTAPAPTAERARRWTDRGCVYLHAPVMMSPQNARAGEGFMLVSGDPDRVEKVLPDLRKMTGKVICLGARPDLAAVHKLIGNLSFLGLYGIVADIFRLANAAGISAEEATATFRHFNPGENLPLLAARVAGGVYNPPDFTTVMARKDVRLMLETAAKGHADLRVTAQVAHLQDDAIARGESELDTSAAFRFPLR